MIHPDIAFFGLGLIIGSFLNVCIYRLPRDISIVRPSSSCPVCSTPIKFYDNIPLLSYLLLRGKCRTCGEKISPRYPLVELLNGLLYLAVLRFFGLGWHLPLLFAYVSATLVISFIDLEFQIIPDVITIPGVIIGLFGASFFLPDPFTHFPLHSLSSGNYPLTITGPSIVGFTNSIEGLLGGYCFFYLIALLGKAWAKTDAMGGGDLKMMAMVGAFMGWKAVLLTTFLGSVTGSLIGMAIMLGTGKGRKTKIPFGPFLAVASLITLFFGGELVRWYFGLYIR
ncbi:MAG: prepilin peptidase [Dissulfurispiraceae bacterium]